MIKKLRYRFIRLAMISLIAVIVIMMASILAVNYHHIVSDADDILFLLAENDGKFPESETLPTKEISQTAPPGSKPASAPEAEPEGREIPFETRFFSVLFNEEGDVLAADTGMVSAIDTEQAVLYAQTVQQGEKNSGFYEDYRYICSYAEDTGELRIIFVDCERSLSNFRSFLFTSMLVCLIGILAVFLMLIIFSERIIRPVAESYEKQKRFITDAGHELKTPLTIIDADAEVLSMDFEEENEWIEDIHLQTSRLAALTADLIMLSRMEEQASSVQVVAFPISDLTEETASSFQALALTQKKDFLCEIQPMLTLNGDPNAYTKLVSILLDNALKYSSDEGFIRLSLNKQGKTIRLSVYNTTGQLDSENIAHLFDRFYRTDKSRNSRTGGYGLGLSIAQAIVTAHHGKITAETTDGQSLRISAVFPL